MVQDNLPRNLERVKNFDKFEPMIRGLTSYDLGKNKIPRRTWEINRKYLQDFQLVAIIREMKTGTQLRKYYDITPIGIFTLLQKLDLDSLEQNFIKNFSTFVPEIARYWEELEKMWGDKLYFILKKSLFQIKWFQWRTETRIVEQKRDENQIKKLSEQIFNKFYKMPENLQEKYSNIIQILKNRQDEELEYKVKLLEWNLLRGNLKSTEPQEVSLVFDLIKISEELDKPNDRIEHPLGTQMVEKTTIPFESKGIDITLSKKYTDFTSGKCKQSRRETGKYSTSIKIVIPPTLKLVNFDKESNNIMNRLAFVFYYNLVRYHKEDVAMMGLASWIWEQQKFESWKNETKGDYINAMLKRNDEKYKIVKEIKKASKKTILVIQKDAELHKMMDVGIKEIKSKFLEPESVNELLSEINR
ncbi:MAG: hypothetical protein IIC67_06505 [Thaumarchaeota archaeon]|nr:hypothetical protein [Nitrososphaerota archaeon]